MNKAELIEALTTRLGDKKTATTALEAVLEEIQRTVSKGGKISLAGFGVFEKRARAARTARNPRTGESVKVKKTSVPAFRPGQGFKDVVRGKKKIAAPKKAAKKATGTTAAKKAGAKKTTATGRKAATKAAPARKTTTARTAKTASKAAPRKTTPRKTATTSATKATKAATKRAPARKTATKSAAKRTPRKR